MRIKAILAIDSNNGIGKNNNLPWEKISEDMKFFKDTTLNNIVVMGRKTYESMGSKILKNRHNIIITSSVNDYKFIEESKDYASSLDSALTYKIFTNKDMFIIGGAKYIMNYLKILININ